MISFKTVAPKDKQRLDMCLIEHILKIKLQSYPKMQEICSSVLETAQKTDEIPSLR